MAAIPILSNPNGPVKVSLLNAATYFEAEPGVLKQPISKSGERFNNSPIFKITGMEMMTKYQVALRFVNVSETRFGQFREYNDIVENFNGTMRGFEWMNNVAQFDITLLSYLNPRRSFVCLNALAKYRMVLVITKQLEDEHGVLSPAFPLEYRFDCLIFQAIDIQI